MVSRRAGPALVVGLLSTLAAARARAERPYPILFVTQTPNPGDFTSVVATFGTHRGTVDSARAAATSTSSTRTETSRT
jgi:hypothetical protein